MPDPSNPNLSDKVLLREQLFRVLQMLVEMSGQDCHPRGSQEQAVGELYVSRFRPKLAGRTPLNFYGATESDEMEKH